MDGFGWLVEKHARVMKCFPAMTRDDLMHEMTSAESWVWYNWALENEMTAFGPLAERVGDGYLKKQVKSVMKQLGY